MSVGRLTKPAPDPERSVHEVDAAPDRAPLAAAGIRVAEVDGAAIDSKQDLMAALADAFELPDYFGGNWDALDEVLRDLGWLEAEGHVLLLNGAAGLRAREPKLVDDLVRSWRFCAETWGPEGVPFHLVLVG